MRDADSGFVDLNISAAEVDVPLYRTTQKLEDALRWMPERITRHQFEEAVSIWSPVSIMCSEWPGLTSSRSVPVIGRCALAHYVREIFRHLEPRNGQFHRFEELDDGRLAFCWSMEVENRGTGRAGIMIRRDLISVMDGAVASLVVGGNLQILSELYERD